MCHGSWHMCHGSWHISVVHSIDFHCSIIQRPKSHLRFNFLVSGPSFSCFSHRKTWSYQISASTDHFKNFPLFPLFKGQKQVLDFISGLPDHHFRVSHPKKHGHTKFQLKRTILKIFHCSIVLGGPKSGPRFHFRTSGPSFSCFSHRKTWTYKISASTNLFEIFPLFLEGQKQVPDFISGLRDHDFRIPRTKKLTHTNFGPKWTNS